MEDLTKNQLVLLTLLISFVTSIATGIMTVSLLQEAPVEVTRTINRVVEKTIETVSPVKDVLPSLTPTLSKEVTKEVTTVIVKEEDSVINAINKNVASIVRITERDIITDTTSFYEMGFVIGKDGTIAAPRRSLSSSNIYTAVMSDGTVFTLGILGFDKKTNFVLFRANATDKSKTKYEFMPVSLASKDPQLGQTVVALGGDQSNTVAVGRVTFLNMKEMTEGTSTTKYVSSVLTDISSHDVILGSVYLNLSGEVVGEKVTENDVASFVPVSILKRELPILSESVKQL